MPNPRIEQRELCSFTSQEWTGRPASGAGPMFVGFSVIAFVLCLILMLFFPGLRDPGATALFVGVFATTFSALVILGKSSRERAFLLGLTATANAVLLELTAAEPRQLSAKEFRLLLVRGTSLPLSVNGVSGLNLGVLREPPPQPKKNPNPEIDVVTTRVVIAATPPDYGISSFDRLLETARTDPGLGGPDAGMDH
jgi:hypothetical protein